MGFLFREHEQGRTVAPPSVALAQTFAEMGYVYSLLATSALESPATVAGAVHIVFALFWLTWYATNIV